MHRLCNVLINNELKFSGRLEKEIIALSNRSLVNLAIGMIATGLAVFILAITVFFPAKKESIDYTIEWYFVQRISLCLFIQVFSFFFLRLYKNNLEDIKYYQNEITSIEFKRLALESAFIINDRKCINDVIQTVSTTDRNSKLRKGETTAELEKLKAENKSLSDLLVSTKDIIGSFKQGKS